MTSQTLSRTSLSTLEGTTALARVVAVQPCELFSCSTNSYPGSPTASLLPPGPLSPPSQALKGSERSVSRKRSSLKDESSEEDLVSDDDEEDQDFALSPNYRQKKPRPKIQRTRKSSTAHSNVHSSPDISFDLLTLPTTYHEEFEKINLINLKIISKRWLSLVTPLGSISSTSFDTTDRPLWWPIKKFAAPIRLAKAEIISVCVALLQSPNFDIDVLATLKLDDLPLKTQDRVFATLALARIDRSDLTTDHPFTSSDPPSSSHLQLRPHMMKRVASSELVPAAPTKQRLRTMTSGPCPPLANLPATPALSLSGSTSGTSTGSLHDTASGFSLLQAEQKIQSRGRQFQLKPEVTNKSWHQSDLPLQSSSNSLHHHRRQNQLALQLQREHAGGHRQFEHHPLASAFSSTNDCLLSPAKILSDNALQLSTMEDYSTTFRNFSGANDDPFPSPPMKWDFHRVPSATFVGSMSTNASYTHTFEDSDNFHAIGFVGWPGYD